MNDTARSLKLLKIEAIIGAAFFAMPIMTEFYQSIGMNFAQIGLSQAIFTIALLALNIPTGWLADRFSRKWCNFVGDLLTASGFAYYAFAEDFSDIIIGEIIVGVGMAFTNGADIALMRDYCKKLLLNFEQQWSHVTTGQPIMQIAAVVVGGFIGAQAPRLAILVSAVPFLIGALLILRMKDVGERRVSEHNPFKDMAIIIRYSLHRNRRLAWTILAAAVAREMTHPIIWLLTPLMLVAGVPVQVIGAGWAINLAAVSLGSLAAGKYALRLKEWQRFALPATASLLAMLVLGLSLSLATIGLYAVFGFARGWLQATMGPMFQAHAPEDIQSTVVSVASSVAQLLYIPLVFGINALADISVTTAMLGSLAIFAPLVLLSTIKLRAYDSR